MYERMANDQVENNNKVEFKTEVRYVLLSSYCLRSFLNYT